MASNLHEYHSPVRSPSRLHRPRTPSRNLDRPPSSTGHQHHVARSSHGQGSSRFGSSNASAPPPNHRSTRQPPPHLSGLPRFHPANYVSSTSTSGHAGVVATQDALSNYSTGPLSPRTSHQLRQYSEAQRQLYLHHRELISLNRSHSPGMSNGVASPGWRSSRPVSPQLKPLGSPGPITPLDLEIEADQSDGYLMAGAGNGQAPLTDAHKEQILESYILKETQDGAMAVSGAYNHITQ